jgi:response regulator RpfG family c-di-GMP phosphodiesterase
MIPKGSPGRRDRGGSDGAPRPDISERVLSYFQRNSEAMDSVEGIARFWVHEDTSVVERCLEDLQVRGLLEKRTIAGTDFYLLKTRAPQAAPPPAPSVLDVERPAPEERGWILVVDDDVSVRKFLVDSLTEAGHTVTAAEDGTRAIEIVRAHPCDLVLTDVNMPGVSGLEVLRAVKHHRPATEVIVVTGYATLETAVTALRHGAYDLITKPLADLESLYRVVERALERRRLSAENRLLVESLQGRNVELKETVARLAAVNEIGKATTGLLDLNELYDSLVRLVAQHLKARRVSVLISEPDSEEMVLVASVGIPEQEATKVRARVGEGIAGQVAATQAPLLVQDIEQSDLKSLRTGGKYATSSFMITPLKISYPIRFQRRRVGVINVSDKHSGDPFNDQDLEFLSTLSSQVAVAIANARLVKEMEDGYLGALVALIHAAEEARPETRGHSKRVVELAMAIARELRLPEARIELLARAAALHEVGWLVGLPEAGAPEQDGARAGSHWTANSAVATERVLAPITSLRGAREIILRSADGFDTAPILFGADRPGIPMESRILAVCEEFVRLTAGSDGDGSRRRAALDAVRRHAGRKHDPDVVAALCRLAGEGPAEEGGAR